MINSWEILQKSQGRRNLGGRGADQDGDPRGIFKISWLGYSFSKTDELILAGSYNLLLGFAGFDLMIVGCSVSSFGIIMYNIVAGSIRMLNNVSAVFCFTLFSVLSYGELDVKTRRFLQWKSTRGGWFGKRKTLTFHRSRQHRQMHLLHESMRPIDLHRKKAT
jgi:hypothetical protein